MLKSALDVASQEEVDFEVVTCFIEYNGQFLVLQRGRRDGQFGLWGIPGGKLESGESPLEGLSREVFEETGIIISCESFLLLDKAHSLNPFDGSYFLYLYYVKLNDKPLVIINNTEHLNYKWVNLHEFEKLNLLVSQGLAFNFVKNKIPNLHNRKIIAGEKLCKKYITPLQQSIR